MGNLFLSKKKNSKMLQNMIVLSPKNYNRPILPLHNLAWLGADNKVHTVNDGLKGTNGPHLLGATMPMLQELGEHVTDAALKQMPHFSADGTTTFTIPKEAFNVDVKSNGMFLNGAAHPYQHTLYVR